MLICFFIGAAADLALAYPRFRQIADGDLFNPDSYMRLVRLDAILAAHAPLHAVARDASGAGTVLAWSHLLDSLLLLCALPLTSVMPWHDALRLAGAALGPIEVGLLCAATAWAFTPLTDKGWRWTTAVASITAPIIGYGMPGVIHHHILLAIAAVMTGGWAGRGLRWGAPAGWQAGIWAAIGLWLSPETMPFSLMAFAALGIAWITGLPGQPAGRALRAAGTVLLLLVTAIVAVDPPSGGWLAVEIDRVSLVYVGMGLAICGIGFGLCGLDRCRLTPASRALLGGAGSVLLLGTWAAAFPTVLLGPGGLPHPEQTSVMFAGVREMQPIVSLRVGAEIIGTGALGAAVIIGAALRRRTALWAYAALCALAIVALGGLHQRFGTYGAVLGAGVLPLAIRWSGERLAQAPPLLRALDRVALLALFVLTPYFAMLAGVAAEAATPPPACSVRQAVGLLAPYAGQVVLANVDDTPELLYRTGVLTVGSLYHRNPQAFMRLREAWRSRSDGVEPAAVLATGAAAILICPGRRAAGLGRSALVADLPDGTLLDRLDRGDPPAWLREAGRDGSGYILYRIAEP
jgi:hypothetical protein